MQRSRFLATAVAAGALLSLGQQRPAAAQGSPMRVVYPNLDGLGPQAFGYRALQLALEKSGQAFQLMLGPGETNHARARKQLDSGGIDVVDFGTSPAFEQQYQALYFPVDRGLNGWRLFVIRASRASAFAAVTDLAGLRRLRAGQGSDWSDAALLEAAGLPVMRATTLNTLFRMLAAGRFDYLPLGLNEVYGLLEHAGSDARDCVVEPRLVLVYPFERLFFVRRGNEALRAVLQAGLTRAFEDGSFNALFAADPSNQTAMARAKLAERRALRIDNPTLSRAAREIPARYFITP